MKIGSKVGARRWPYAYAHFDCWGKPWQGVVLSVRDARAWERTIAFPSATPKAKEIAAHCERHSIVDGGDSVPVLWDFGTSGLKVHWERRASLRPYALDLTEWVQARWEAQQQRAKGAA